MLSSLMVTSRQGTDVADAGCAGQTGSGFPGGIGRAVPWRLLQANALILIPDSWLLPGNLYEGTTAAIPEGWQGFASASE